MSYLMTPQEKALSLPKFAVNDSTRDYIGWHAHAHVDKWQPSTVEQFTNDLKLPGDVQRDDLFGLGIKPDLTADEAGNLLLNAGITRLLNLLVAAGGTQAYDNTHTRLGAGDTNTAAAASQTDLSATVNAANRYWQMADSTYPSISAQTLTLVATFASGNGNFAWAEWGIDQGTASAANAATAPMLNRKVASLGTKVSGAVWAFTVTIVIS